MSNVTIKMRKPETCGKCMFYRQGSYQDMAATIPYCSCLMGYMDGRDMRDKTYKDALYPGCGLVGDVNIGEAQDQNNGKM